MKSFVCLNRDVKHFENHCFSLSHACREIPKLWPTGGLCKLHTDGSGSVCRFVVENIHQIKCSYWFLIVFLWPMLFLLLFHYNLNLMALEHNTVVPGVTYASGYRLC
ncbi:Hypothetical predicted protein [Podarcis lilfordi]|uniref:Uncharacterized protein n=1 Tax=Podarcis lilfordi TaxID=74358 RepID=A0AA35KKV6_9SAUR|nr:Hypothetical predicted protein [Podarcis lilfordi]